MNKDTFEYIRDSNYCRSIDFKSFEDNKEDPYDGCFDVNGAHIVCLCEYHPDLCLLRDDGRYD